MNEGGKLYFAVTNDLSFDQRMRRICTTLAGNGFDVTLVGRKMRNSAALQTMPFLQKRLPCFFQKGFFFYAEFNLRLFFFLYFKRIDAVCAIDLDTIVPCYLISLLKNTKRVYDAHELFCEMKEVVTRPAVHKLWKIIERYFLPNYKNGYTVNSLIAHEFAAKYHVDYQEIRNLPWLRELSIPIKKEKLLLYQGAVNEGRSFETLIPAMKRVRARLLICGTGNFIKQTRKLVEENGLQEKIIFEGPKSPDDLRKYTVRAWAGITLFDNSGRSNYLSLCNRFFDYMHAGIPQLCVNYPLYSEINRSLPFALLIGDVDEGVIADGLNRLLEDESLYNTLQENCLQRRLELNWQNEEKKLLSFYNKL